jgi:hypothetical protein
MNGASIIEHRGTQVVLLDFSGMQDPDVGLAVIADTRRFVTSLPADGSARTCTDVTDTRYDRRVVEAFKEMTTANAPHVKAAAVVNRSAIHRAAITMIALFARRRIEVFETRTLALDWLVSQP